MIAYALQDEGFHSIEDLAGKAHTLPLSGIRRKLERHELVWLVEFAVKITNESKQGGIKRKVVDELDSGPTAKHLTAESLPLRCSNT